MKKQYKALMLDLDGTTVPNTPSGMPSQIVKEAVWKANKKVHVGAVTGRPFFYAKNIVNILALTGPSIANGGAVVIDSATGDILWKKVILDDELSQIVTLLKKDNIKMLIQTNDAGGKHSIYDGTQSLTDIGSIGLPDLQPEKADELHEKLKQFSNIAIYKIVGYKEGTNWLQISHAEATKQHGILEVAKILGVETHEIIAVGDGYNDFPLLMACGLKVAMGNAVPELKAIADYIAPTVDEDGVADVIEKFIL
jgi:HAD superfamily hydrolase (TIGR01484 family)